MTSLTKNTLFAWLLATFTLTFLLTAEVADQESSKPNVIFLLIDDCSAVELSCYATPEHPSGGETPTIDRLAAEGLRFETCWATPLCMPTRALFISGKYGHRTGQYGNKLSNHSLSFAETHVPLSQRMKKLGYQTALVGKWHLPGSPEQEEYMWDEYSTLGGYLGGHGPNLEFDGDWFSWNEPANTYHDVGIIGKHHNTYPSLYWNGAVVENGKLLATDADTYAPDQNHTFAMDFIERNQDKPFFMYYPIVLTHDPWFETPDRDGDGKRGAPGMASQVKQLDLYLADLEARLKKLHLWENTILIISGDNATLAYGKGTCAEVGVRVPLIVTGGPVKARGVSKALVDFSDLYPTILECAGSEVQADMGLDGVSFKAAIDGETFEGKPYIFSYLDRQRTIRNATHSMDNYGGIWKCDASGNILDATPMVESDETRNIRAEFLKMLESHPAPSDAEVGDRAPFDGDYQTPIHSKSAVRYMEMGDEWMHHERRMRP